MSGIRSIHRNPTVKGFATAASAPIYVDSDDNALKFIPAGTGTTEVVVAVAAQASGFKFAAGTGTLVTGALIVATGLSTVLGFTATVKEPATGTYLTGATEVHSINVKSITTGAVSVDGIYNSFTTGAATVSVSGTAVFYWLAVGT